MIDNTEKHKDTKPEPGVLKLGKGMVRIDLRDPDLPPRCLPMFTKMTPGPCK